jgi:hypothetical protein
MKIEVDSVENRAGGLLGPDSFGYVYFTDGSRVGYSPGLPDHLPVWQPRTNGGGRYQEVTMDHFVAAFQVLRRAGVITDADTERLRELVAR